MAPLPGATETGSSTESAAELAFLAKEAGWVSENDQITAVAIALAESGGDPKARGPQRPGVDARGLWQINWPAWKDNWGMGLILGAGGGENLYSPTLNAKAAHYVYVLQGWKAWTVYTNGDYRKHLDQARVGVKNPQKPGELGQGKVNTVSVFSELFAPIIDFIKSIGLRLAGFIGGGGLVILGIVLYVRKTR